jgi:hypothetical protein
MSTRNIPVGKVRPARKADKLTAIYELIVWQMWEPRCLTALWAFTACYKDALPLSFLLLLSYVQINQNRRDEVENFSVFLFYR